MTQLMEAKHNYLREFSIREQDIVDNRPAWLRALREKGRDRFFEIGFPSRRSEEWRYTNIAPIIETQFELSEAPNPVSREDLAPYTLAEGGVELVFIDGHFSPKLSTLAALPKNVEAGSLAAAVMTENAHIEAHLGRYAQFQDHAFVALNTAFLDDGAYVRIPRNVIVEQPIHLLYIATSSDRPLAYHLRNLILAEENCQATLVETYVGLAADIYYTNAVTEIVCAENAVVDHYKVQRESIAAFHIATTQIQMARASNFTSHSFSLGGSLVRNDFNAVLADEGIECTLNGLYLAHDNQLIDNHTAIDHAMPNCNSHELYKGILDGRGRGVFNGKILVRQDAQKTDAKQTNQALLLSTDAQVNTKPQLEIYADDVKCTHGATIGQLSEEALFYLRSRGIDKDTARELLIYAFASDIVSRIKVDPVRTQLDHVLLSERAMEGIAQ